ncbi:MAG: hypothetical protein Q4D27_02365 [Coriobacteriia bacterium]|nr:hypothetical protein [Coriobacteriia bacterium]
MRVPLDLNKPATDAMRSVGIQVLCSTFAHALDVKAPRVAGLSAHRGLKAFREFSAACMEEALVSPAYAEDRRAQLEGRARTLGAQLRAVLAPRDEELAYLVSWLYAAIDIEVSGEIPGELVFNRCSFSGRYTPQLCWFMSAFDSGFIGGLCGGGRLEFHARITEGAPCCRALYMPEEGGGR